MFQERNHKRFEKIFLVSDNGDSACKHAWDEAKTGLGGKCTVLEVYIKMEKFKIHILSSHLQLENEELS